MSRRDYYHDPDAPKPDRIVPAVTAAVFRGGRVLLGRRVDNGQWALPGGAINVGESGPEAAIRETREETGLEIKIVGLVGVYTDPGHVIAYDDGEVRQQFSICYIGQYVGGTLRPQTAEAHEVAFFVPYELPDLPIHPAQRLRIKHACRWNPTTPAHVG